MIERIDRELRRLPPAARLDRLVDLDRRIAALHAEQYILLALINADPPTTSLPGVDDKHWAVEDVACALRLTPGVARARLAEAVEAVRLPRALDLLAAGSISVAHVRVLTDATMPLDDATASAVEGRVVERAAEQSASAFRTSVRRAVLIEAAQSLEDRRQANVAERRVCTRPGGEGTTELWALLPDEGAAAIMAAVNAFATRTASDDERTADQRRADALVQLGLDALAGEFSQSLPRQQRMRPAVQVTVALSTLLDLDDSPGELAGVGPISASVARRLASDPSGTWRRVVTDPVGRLVDYGRSTYRPPADLARHVMARDRRCRFPHCTRAAEGGELDHSQPWSEGGTTNADNLVALCRRHHHLRHETRWTYRRDPTDGGTTWTSPTGFSHLAASATYPINTDTATAGPINTDTATAGPIDTAAMSVRFDDPDPPPF